MWCGPIYCSLPMPKCLVGTMTKSRLALFYLTSKHPACLSDEQKLSSAAGRLVSRMSIRFPFFGSFVSFSCSSANLHYLPQQRICCLTHIVYHVCICIFAWFLQSQQKRSGAQMTPFPGQWHHLAVEDPFNSFSYPPCLPLAQFPQRSL